MNYNKEKPKKYTSNKERIDEITGQIEEKVADVFASENYRNYLDVLSKFPRYSTNNCMLIYMQNPNATHVAGYSRWKEFGRQVKEGSKGIKIIAPAPYTVIEHIAKINPETGERMKGPDGADIFEQRTITRPSFKVTTVFDISQTEGKELPQLVNKLTGEVESYDDMMHAIAKTAPVPIEFREIPENEDGYFSSAEQKIVIRKEMSEVQTICALIHETAHALLHNPELSTGWKIIMEDTEKNTADYMTDFESREDALEALKNESTEITDSNGHKWFLSVAEDTSFKEKSRQRKEVEAESIAYVVCKYFGIDTDENSLGYIAGWSRDHDTKFLRESLDTINKTASKLIFSIEDEYAQRIIDPAERLADEIEYISYRAEPDKYQNKKEGINKIKRQIENGEIEEIRSLLISCLENPALKERAKKAIAVLDHNYENRFLPPAQALAKRYAYIVNGQDVTREGTDEYVKAYKYASEHLTVGKLMPLIDKIEDIVKEKGPDGTIDMFREDLEKYKRIYCESMLYKLKDDLYFHIQMKDDGINADYTMYKTDTYQLFDGGITDFDKNDPLSGGGIYDLGVLIAETYGYSEKDIMVATEITLDEIINYPPPVRIQTARDISDPCTDLTEEDLEKYGYTQGDMLPLTKERAKELFEDGCGIYELSRENASLLIEDEEELEKATGMIAIEKGNWINVYERVQGHDLQRPKERELYFDDKDGYGIYQLKNTKENHDLLFENYLYLKAHNTDVIGDRYMFVYRGELTELDPDHTLSTRLDGIYDEMNIYKPEEYKGRSVSVGDVIALKENGVISFHFVDSIGFKEIPGFIDPVDKFLSKEIDISDDLRTIDELVDEDKENASKEKQYKQESILTEKEKSSEEKISLLEELEKYKQKVTKPEPKKDKKKEMEL